MPVFERKGETDANYERCVRLLHDHHGEVRAAFGTHNLRSLAYAVAYARRKGIADSGYEIQMLYGMAEPMQAAVRRMGLRLRVYAPVGELVPGMAYLVRRLLENTSNESFVRHRFAEGRALDELLTPPASTTCRCSNRRPASADRCADPAPYEPEPVAEWRGRRSATPFAVAIDAAAATPDHRRARGHRRRPRRTSATIESSIRAVRTGRGADAACTAADADAAVAAAETGSGHGATPRSSERAAVLFRAAAWMRDRRPELAALEVFEAGKPWDQADADVCEAIDFCEYYGREMLRLDAAAPVQSPPGERNRLGTRARASPQ